MHYEFVVIGGGLAGLSVAKKLATESAKVLLIEGQDNLLGSLRSVETPVGSISNGLRLLPVTDQLIQGLEFFESLLPGRLEYTRADVETLTYEAGGFRPFLGFGDHPPRFMEQIATFLGKQLFTANPPVETWSQLLAGETNFETMTRSYATRFEIQDDKVKTLWVNGQKKITADQFIFAGPLAQLKNLLPTEAWSAKALTRYSKLKFWTLVGLDLVHAKHVAEPEPLFLLDGATPDDLGPCIGQFRSANEAGQVSQWMTYLEDDEAEDSEVLAHALKKAKRQIKRAFPEALEGLLLDRVCVFPSYCADLPTTAFLPELGNLHFANGQLSSLPGPCGSLDRARAVLQSLGFLPQNPVSTSRGRKNRDSSADQTDDLSSETGDVHP